MPMSQQEALYTALQQLKNRQVKDDGTLEDILVQTYGLLDSSGSEDYNLCLAVICHVANGQPQGQMAQQLLHDCIIKSRIFLYNDLMREHLEAYCPKVSISDIIAGAIYTSARTDTILTRAQKQIFDAFENHRHLVVSAPTSFGKTRIVQEIIAHNKYKNIAFIVPTVSLLSEQYQELKNTVEGYVISKSSKVSINSEDNYLFILTPERMGSFLDEHPDFPIDFFVMDEIYKVDYKLDDGRFRVFADVLYRLAKSGAHFYLIGPYIDRFSEKFLKRFRARFLRFTEEIVQKDFYELGSPSQRKKHKIEDTDIRIVGDKFTNLVRLISAEAIDGKFLVYRYQKQYVEQLATKYLSRCCDRPYNEQLIAYLSENFSPEWDLIKCIQKGIAFHHGGMPRHIQDLIVDEFNRPRDEGIDVLFCTTSLTEGVNTSAKNVVLYDKKIGLGDPLSELDRKNIEGRAGRFMRHFVGRVFHLEDGGSPDKETNVELEAFDSPVPADETLLQIDEEDLTPLSRSKRLDAETKIDSASVPVSLIRSNRYVSVEGQLRLISRLRNTHVLKRCFFSTNFPNNATVREILSLIYDHIFTEADKGRDFNNDMGKKILLDLTCYYIFYTPSFSELLASDTVSKARNNTSTRIRYVFTLLSQYFEFSWPKYLKTFETLYRFTASEKGYPAISLDMVIAKLEYGTTQNHEILLRDCGLPMEIVKKISGFFLNCQTFEDIRNVCAQRRGTLQNLLTDIEAKILFRYI